MVRITEHAAETGAVLPSDAELSWLLAKVREHHSLPGFTLDDFRLGFIGQGRFFRLVRQTRRDRYYHDIVARAGELVGREIRGDAFLAACLCDGVPVRLASPSMGQLLEVGL